MGLSSSQARLLSLTGRMHDIEYKAQKLEAQKLQMANESAHVYQEYENALNATKIQLKQIAGDGSATFIDATYNNLISSGYTIKYEGYEGILVTQVQANYFTTAGSNKEYFIALETGRSETVDGYKEIYTASQLANVISTPTSDLKLRLMSDIDMSRTSFTPSDFTGLVLDGNGHAIIGLEKNLFDNLTDSTITNLKLDANIDNDTSKGILANEISRGTVENVILSGSITYTGGEERLGALAGQTSNANINQVSSSADVKATGLINNPEPGQNSNTITGCIGGLIGEASGGGEIKNCTVSNAEITGGYRVGGLIGMSSSNISNSLVQNSTISATTGCGTGNNDSYVGGLLGRGYGTNVTVTSCSSQNNTITAKSIVAGGFVGSAGGGWIAKNCFASSSVYAKAQGNGYYAGEFIGMWNNVTIKDCTSTGIVKLEESADSYKEIPYFAGLPAEDRNTATLTIKNCYNGETDANNFIVSMDNFTYAKVDGDGIPATTSTTSITPPTSPSIQVNASLVEQYPVIAALYDDMKAQGYHITTTFPHTGHENDTLWLTNMLQAGLLFLFKKDNDGISYQVNVATDTNLQEVTDDTELKKAEAKYEADMRKINAKDKKFDTDIAALETERNAIKTEMDTLKSVAKDNVDRTFKLFS